MHCIDAIMHQSWIGTICASCLLFSEVRRSPLRHASWASTRPEVTRSSGRRRVRRQPAGKRQGASETGRGAGRSEKLSEISRLRHRTKTGRSIGSATNACAISRTKISSESSPPRAESDRLISEVRTHHPRIAPLGHPPDSRELTFGISGTRSPRRTLPLGVSAHARNSPCRFNVRGRRCNPEVRCWYDDIRGRRIWSVAGAIDLCDQGRGARAGPKAGNSR